MSTLLQALRVLISRLLGNNNMDICHSLEIGNYLETKNLKLGNIISVDNVQVWFLAFPLI